MGTRWRPAKAITRLVGQLDSLFPDRTKPDWMLGDRAHRARRSDHNPDRDGVVRAVDVREGGGFHPGWLWDRLLDCRDPRLSYVIFDGRWFRGYRYGAYQPWTVIPYRGSNPHRTHVHVSVGGRRVYDSEQRWELDIMDDFLDGAKGHTIKVVQRLLSHIDLYHGTVDGILGLDTQRAIFRLNSQHGDLSNGNVLTNRSYQVLVGRAAAR